MPNSPTITHEDRKLFRKSFVLSIFVAYLYAFLEWLFLFTKPSFLNAYSVFESFGFFLVTGFWWALLASIIQTAVLSAILFTKMIFPNINKLPFSSLLPGSMSATLTLLLLDNFTYTVLRKGIVHTESPQSYVLTLAFILLVILFTRFFQDKLKALDFRALNGIAITLVSASFLLFSGRYLLSEKPLEYKWPGGQRPNILFFAADGIEARRLSAYGAERKTTPRLDQILGDSLVAENAIANSGFTTGSMTSMFTGKFPTTTKVLYPPNAFNGEDTLEHLPFILQELGYTGIQETIRYYADNIDLNLQYSFDTANGRKLRRRPRYLPLKFLATFSPDLLLHRRISERALSRLKHLFGIEKMSNIYEAVTDNKFAQDHGLSDDLRMQRTLEFIDNAKEPFFIHLHLMSTHCCTFYPKHRIFSKEHNEQTTENRLDFYDDIILQQDEAFGVILDKLESRGLLENTIIVYSSDHDSKWAVWQRIPLIIRFPGKEHKGFIKKTVQLLDISPTILDYLGIPTPPWMEGQSLLNSENIDPARILYSVIPETSSEIVVSGPPLYGLSFFASTACQTQLIFDIKSERILYRTLGGHTAPCAESTLPTLKQRRLEMMGHLKDRGFELPF